jgi:hypothetical protein
VTRDLLSAIDLQLANLFGDRAKRASSGIDDGFDHPILVIAQQFHRLAHP